MTEPMEEVVGEVWVSTNLRFGSERIRLLLTDRRVIVDHAGKRGPGAVAGASILGDLSRGLESLIRGGADSVGRRHVEKMSPAQILRAHKDNFDIANNEVVNVAIEKALPLNKITILTVDDKYEFHTQKLFEDVVTLFSKRLKEKLVVRKQQEQEPHH